jgi:heterodisulfide reductase subunit B
MKFSLYPGCTEHSTSAEFARSMEAVFEHLGAELSDIGDWNCCGAAATHSVNEKLSLALPARNIALAQTANAGPLVIPCAGCYAMLKRSEKAMRDDPGTKAEIERIVGFTYDPSFELLALLEAVVDRIGLPRIGEAVRRPLAGMKTACYYGCALVRRPSMTGFDDPEDPRMMEQLMAVLGATPVEWSFKLDCCGADLALTKGKEVCGIVDRIVGMAKEAGADCLVTSCGLCQANLELRQSHKMPVFYFTELMGVAFDIAGRSAWWRKHMINPKALLAAKGLS